MDCRLFENNLLLVHSVQLLLKYSAARKKWRREEGVCAHPRKTAAKALNAQKKTLEKHSQEDQDSGHDTARREDSRSSLTQS